MSSAVTVRTRGIRLEDDFPTLVSRNRQVEWRAGQVLLDDVGVVAERPPRHRQHHEKIGAVKLGTRATWIEWGNVRFSKQYAHYIQDHHAYAFDFIGHMRQHWQPLPWASGLPHVAARALRSDHRRGIFRIEQS
jgi:hypothetical protein